MEEIYEYYIYAATVFLFFIFGFSFGTYFSVRKILSYFTNKKFRIVSLYEIEPTDTSSHFKVTFYNNNIQDIRLVSMGFIYKNQNIDLYNTYLKQNLLGEGAKVVVDTKDSISIRVDYHEFKKLILDLNLNSIKVSKLQVFATDSLGSMSIFKAKTVKKILKNKLKEDKMFETKEIKILKLKNRSIKRKENMIIRSKKRVIRVKIRKQLFIASKEIFSNISLKTKKIFTKKTIVNKKSMIKDKEIKKEE